MKLSIKGIKEWTKRNQADLALFFGFILVALISFGAGRLSAPKIVQNPVIIDESGSSTTAAAILSGVESEKGMFVASKGGTKFHWPWCSYAQKIKAGNQVWFKTEKEAQDAGFAPCGCISQKAPAGYSQ